MAIKSVQAIVNGVTTTLTYDSASKTYKATLSFLVATNGYDKVIQAIKQIKQIEKQ